MPIVEIGRICIKKKGREAGRRCVIVDIIDNNYVLVTGPKSLTGVRRRRANILHLELTSDKIDIPKGASDEEVAKALQEAGFEWLSQASK
ncbi:MAG: 50S ribosomal protein L14e [Candidatus Verstraetearchaeota archaeon]|nr:50S ribosomal protein L14e [Candidatus Verstraetearchaeota archaeon]